MRRRIQVDSEDESDSDSDASFQPSPKRKRGRPPSAKNKRKRVQDDSDDSQDAPTQPLTSQNGRSNSPQDSDDDSGSDSDVTVNARTGAKKITPVVNRAGRPTRAVNRRRLSNDSDGGTPQPSTSGVANGISELELESESGSETPDSDYGPLNERNQKMPKLQKKREKKQKVVKSKSKLFNGSASKYPPSSGNFDSDFVEGLAQKLVYFLLIEDQKKYAIKRKAIVASVFKDESYSPKLYIAVIIKANHILKKTYGMELIELENQKDAYLIVNILKKELGVQDFVEMSRLKQQQYGLILYILTVIFMNDNMITEDELTKSLMVLGIDLTSKKMHPVFGDVKKYITTELVKQMYLDYKRVSKEPLRYEFTWGLRAKQEFDKVDLLQFACEIMDDTIPEDWRIQFKDAQGKL